MSIPVTRKPMAGGRGPQGEGGTRGEQTRVIDLETETLPLEQNLQEALRRKRPDYIQRTKTREQDRMARSYVAANKSRSGH